MSELPSTEDCPTADGMPMLGLGTWQNEDPEQCAESVRTALEMGYRHVDTAQVYGNEAAVGEGIAAADVDREDVFLATKVWTDELSATGVRESTQASLDRLGVDHVDLMYVHWPAGDYDPEETLPAFDGLVDDGLVRHVGVSNFQVEQLDRAREVLDAPVFANQVELHPFLSQENLRAYCAGADVELVAYSPLARGAVLENDVLGDVADTHGVSAAQVSLAWLRAHGVTAIPKATGRDHVADNWASLALDLTDEEVARIDAVEERNRQVDPGFAPWN
jgi:2,5-diketo-D-gluconate reductase B